MTIIDFYDHLAEIALGWMGWSEEQALRTDVNAILVAYEGRMQMFEQVGWVSRVPAEPQQDPRVSVRPAREVFDAIWG